MSKKQEEQHFSFHRPIDQLDPGFKVRGMKFHWVSARKAESSPDRPWISLMQKDLPDSLVSELKRRSPGFFGQDGFARKGDLVLSFATPEAVEPYRQERLSENREQLERVNHVPHGAQGMTVKAERDEEFDIGAEAFKNL